jgi:SAM-dependent methyltransferase/chromosome segregation ATPase
VSDARPPAAQGEAERFVPDGHGPLIRYEHLHRYVLACRAVAGRRVLDLGCGSGYGSRLLRAAGAQVISVDFDRAAARCPLGARARGEQLPFRNASFDAVVCFETLEHLTEPGALVREVARVLTRDGFALLSTPDREIYSGRAGNRNPYHLAELTQAEFRALLAQSFRAVALYGQSVWAGSWIARLDSDGAPARAAERALRVLEAPPLDARAAASAPWTETGDARAPIPLYLVAACARSRKGLERVESALGAESVLHDSAQGLIGDYLAAQLDVASRDQQLLSFEKHCANLETIADGHRANAENLARRLEEESAAAAGHRANAENLTRRLEEETRAGAGHRAHAENQTRLLAERDAEVDGLREHATNLEKLKALLDGHVENLTRSLAEREAAAAGHRAHAENLAAAMAERDAQIAGLQEHGANLARLIAERDTQIAGLQEHAENLARLVAERDAQIAGLQEHGANLARLVAERDAQIAGFQEHAENLARLVAERDATSAGHRAHAENLTAVLADRDAQIARIREESAELARRLGEQSEILARIRASRWFRVLQRAGVFEP